MTTQNSDTREMTQGVPMLEDGPLRLVALEHGGVIYVVSVDKHDREVVGVDQVLTGGSRDETLNELGYRITGEWRRGDEEGVTVERLFPQRDIGVLGEGFGHS